MAELNVTGPGQVRVGNRTRISDSVQFVFHRESKVTIGDYCTLGPGVKLVCDGGDIAIGDWTTIHDGSLLLSTQGMKIGQHCWFGQHCVLDGTGSLSVGNGVRVGMYSQIWSHVAAGERIEGCTLFGTRPVDIEDDVWLVGSCIVASGVTLGRRAIALIGSNITKSWPPSSVLAGSPAKPKDGLHFYKQLSVDEKWAMLIGWVREIAADLALLIDEPATDTIVVSQERDSGVEHVVFTVDQRRTKGLPDFHGATICDLTTKTYIKRLTDIEESVLRRLAGNKARFYNKESME